MAAKFGVALIAAIAALGGLAAASAQDVVPQGHTYSPPFLPEGHLYAPGEERLPPINSPQSKFQAQVDIVETEIYRRQYERRLFESEMFRDDLRPGPLDGPRY